MKQAGLKLQENVSYSAYDIYLYAFRIMLFTLLRETIDCIIELPICQFYLISSLIVSLELRFENILLVRR